MSQTTGGLAFFSFWVLPAPNFFYIYRRVIISCAVPKLRPPHGVAFSGKPAHCHYSRVVGSKKCPALKLVVRLLLVVAVFGLRLLVVLVIARLLRPPVRFIELLPLRLRIRFAPRLSPCTSRPWPWWPNSAYRRKWSPRSLSIVRSIHSSVSQTFVNLA